MTGNKRRIVLALAVSLCCAQAGFCAVQTPSLKQKSSAKTDETNDGASKAPTDDRLNALLRDWDRVRLGPRESHQKFTWTRTSPDAFAPDGFNKVVSHAEMWIKRPDRLRIEARDQKGDLCLTLLCVGERVRIYFFNEKKELSFSLPDGFRLPENVGPRAPINLDFLQTVNAIFIWSVLGPPLSALNGRFDVHLEKEDDYWSYIRFDPIRNQAWPPNLEGQVVLDKRNHWLRRVWLHNDPGFFNLNIFTDFKVNISTDFEEPIDLRETKVRVM